MRWGSQGAEPTQELEGRDLLETLDSQHDRWGSDPSLWICMRNPTALAQQFPAQWQTCRAGVKPSIYIALWFPKSQLSINSPVFEPSPTPPHPQISPLCCLYTFTNTLGCCVPCCLSCLGQGFILSLWLHYFPFLCVK